MGVIFSILKVFLNYFARDDKIKICFLGPAGSGKTSLMYYYNCRDKVLTIPTNGYNTDVYKFKKKEFVFWDVGAPQIRNWPGFVEAADFLFFVIDCSDINSILSAKELLHQIYFGKRFRMFLEDLKEREIQRNDNYFFQEDEEDKNSYNGEDYLNLIEDPSDYDFIFKSRKLDSEDTETDKTSNLELENEFSSSGIKEKEEYSKIESSEFISKIDFNKVQENNKNINHNSDSDYVKECFEEEKNASNNKKIKKRRKINKKNQVQVCIEMSNKTDQSINNSNSPLKNPRKFSNQMNKYSNSYTAIPNEKLNYSEVFNKKLTKKPLLIITNKQDLPQAHTSEEIANILGLYYLKDIKWYIRGTSSVNGEGLNECLDWVIDNIANKINDVNKSPSFKKSK